MKMEFTCRNCNKRKFISANAGVNKDNTQTIVYTCKYCQRYNITITL